MTVTAVVAIAVSMPGAQPATGGRTTCTHRRPPESERDLADEQRSELGSAGPRGAGGRRDAGGRLSVRLRTSAGGALPAIWRGRRRAGIARRRRGRRSDSVQARGPRPEAGQRGQLAGSRSGAEMPAAGRAAGDVHAVSVRDRTGHGQDPHLLCVLERGARHPSRRGGDAPDPALDGAFGRPLGGRHTGRRRHGSERANVVRPRGELSQRRAAPGRALLADHAGRHPATR